MATNIPPEPPSNRRGAAGGSASTGGAAYAGAIASWFAVKMLLGSTSQLPWTLPQGTYIREIACENDSEVDDLILHLFPQGTVYIQIKHGLRFGTEFSKAAAQLVRQYLSPGFSSASDMLVIATDHSAARNVSIALKRILNRHHNSASGSLLRSLPTNNIEEQALGQLLSIVTEKWLEAVGRAPTEDELSAFLKRADILLIDPLAGNESQVAKELLSQVIEAKHVGAAWSVLNDRCLRSAWLRQSLDLPGLWAHLRSELLPVAPRGLPAAIFRDLLKRTMNQLEHIGRYSPNTYVQRKSVDTALSDFLRSQQKILLVSGGSGRGKSCWAADSCQYSSIGSSQHKLAAVLLRGEDLSDGDRSLFHSLARTIRDFMSRHGAPMVPETELIEWLGVESSLIFVDGLDRAPAPFRAGLLRWAEGTVAELSRAPSKLVITTRPETIAPLLVTLGPQERLYQHVELGEFTKTEAEDAAQALGRPELARIHHPSLMAFAASLGVNDLVTAYRLRPSEIVEAYVEHRLRMIETESGLLAETVSAFIDRMARTLAESPDGELGAGDLAALRSADASAYDAVRRSNLLSIIRKTGRVEPDEVSEHLQSRHTDPEVELARLESILKRPLKLGALRAKLVSLAGNDAPDTKKYADTLLGELESRQDVALLSVACSMLAAFMDSRSALPLARRIGAIWKRENFLTVHGFGSELLALLSASRWSTSERLELLWTQSTNESGFDWRPKHWLRPIRNPSSTMTPWCVAMVDALALAGGDGFRFLLQHVDSDHAFSDTDEAALGDLAHGLYVMAAASHFIEAFLVAATAPPRTGAKIRAHLAERYPDRTISDLPELIANGCVPGVDVSEMLRLASFDEHDPANLESTLRQLLSRPRGDVWRNECLRLLSGRGDAGAAKELVDRDGLTLDDVFTFHQHTGAVYAFLIDRLYARIRNGECEPDLLSGLRLSTSDIEADLLLSATQMHLQATPSHVIKIASLTEHLMSGALKAERPPRALPDLINDILAIGNPAANGFLIYGATGHRRESFLSEAGDKLRVAITEMLLARVDDSHGIDRMVNLIAERYRDEAQAIDWIVQLFHRHPKFDVLRIPKALATYEEGVARLLLKIQHRLDESNGDAEDAIV